VSVFTNPASGTPEEGRAYVAAVLGLLGDEDPLAVLRDGPEAVEQALAGLPVDQLGTPEAPGKWSMAAVVQHLADAELVWGWRLRLVLVQDRPAITGYDQDRWAERLRYDRADAKVALWDFASLRRSNLRLLKGASAADLDRVGVHEERGEESVGHTIRLYAGHDLMHRRQLARIRAALEAEG